MLRDNEALASLFCIGNVYHVTHSLRSPVALADDARKRLSAELDPSSRSARGQFFTPPSVASLMASMSSDCTGEIRLLDPGAGAGALTAGWVEDTCQRASRPRKISITAIESDSKVAQELRVTLGACVRWAAEAGVECEWEVVEEDFISFAVERLDGGMFTPRRPGFDFAILNPPYRKFRTDSTPRMLLRRLGFATSNMYTAFVALAADLLNDGGEVVAITPRSFCNGPYFRPFRERFLGSASLSRIHVFASRDEAFGDDDVLQENVIIHARWHVAQESRVLITESESPDAPSIRARAVPFKDVVRPGDGQRFIHLVPDERGSALAQAMHRLPCLLSDLGLQVSTGRVVDFRARQWLRPNPGPETVPLIYPGHFSDGRVVWPKTGRKPNGISRMSAEGGLLVPGGVYVLVKRFTAKQERRRVVAAVFDPSDVPTDWVGFENHLNYFHAMGDPMNQTLARGLAAFLNSSAVDTYIRQFNGHTQVNATDLRSLRYPTSEFLVALGVKVAPGALTQERLDVLVGEALSVAA